MHHYREILYDIASVADFLGLAIRKEDHWNLYCPEKIRENSIEYVVCVD